MTDKQIIDVSQCPHYKRGNVCTFLSYETKCEGECIWVTYKEMEEQRKRAEQTVEECHKYQAELEDKLEAKEQECEELKKKLKINEVFVDDVMESRHYCVNSNSQKERKILELQQQLDQLKAERDSLKSELMQTNCYLDADKEIIDQLKADLQDYQEWFDEFKLMFRYDDREPDSNDELYSCLESVVDENDKLKQTLIEIKEIAEENIRIADLEGLNGVYRRGLAKQILQKISEVEKW